MNIAELKNGEVLNGGIYSKITVKGRNVSISGVIVENAGIAIYSNYNCSDLVIRNSKIISSENNAIKIVADKVNGVINNIKFINCEFEFARMGCELQNHGNSDYKIDNVLFDNCKFTSLTSSSYKYGISLSGYGKNVKIINSTFNCAKGIELVGFSNVNIDNNIINGFINNIISSNTRHMSNINITNNKLNGKPFLYNCSDSEISNNEISCNYVEIKKSNNVLISNNNVTSSGHYSLLFNDAPNNIVTKNTFNQNGKTNWAVIRCYGELSKDNKISNNIINKNKTGKLFDQYNGASENIFEK